MKYTLAIISLSIFLSANEFAYIQPISVEEAPSKQELQKSLNQQKISIEKDDDLDGIGNSKDRCPKSAIGVEVNKYGCEIDSDGDGIVNSKDSCRGTPDGFIVDAHGCPQTAKIDISFEANSSHISNADIEGLKEFTKFLKQNPSYQVIIYGYTDNSGDNKKNIKLSRSRAEAVKDALIDLKISETRLTAIGKGDADPIADNKTIEGRIKNRRIEVDLLY